MSRPLCLLALFLVIVREAGAQTTDCATIPNGSPSTCYASRASCHYNQQSTVCEFNPPATCMQYGADSVGCVANTACHVNPQNNQCTDNIVACSALSQSQCVLRSDCHYNSTMCVDGPVAGSCGTHTTQLDCQNAGCLYHVYEQRCFTSMAEVTALYACSHWSYYPYTGVANACSYNGCSLATDFMTCFETGSGVGDTDTELIYRIDAAFMNPTLDLETMQFSLDVMTPNPWDYLYPKWPVIGFGTFWDASRALEIDAPAPYVAATTCNSLSPGSTTPSMTPPHPVSQANISSTYFTPFLIDWVRDFGAFNLSTGTNEQRMLHDLNGDFRVCPSCPVRSVSLSPDAQDITYHLSKNINGIVSECNSTGVSVSAEATTYTVPVTYLERDSDGHSPATIATFTIAVSSDNHVTYGPTGRNQGRHYIESVTYNTQNCTGTGIRAEITYRLRFAQAYDANSVVGPRYMSDLYANDPSLNGILTQCYGDRFIGLEYLGIYDAMYHHRVVKQTRCMPILEDGTVFQHCANNYDAARIADMGSDTAYPVVMDGHHDFYMDVYLCPLARTNDTDCVLFNRDLGGAPDFVVNTVSPRVFPTEIVALSIHVLAGLLPTPTSTFDDFLLLADTFNSSVNSVDLRNSQLYFDKSLTFVVQHATESTRTLHTLKMMLNNLTFVPVDGLGNTLDDRRLTWSQIAPYVTHAPRDYILSVCPSCAPLPSCANVIGRDGFAVPVNDLRRLMDAPGYRLELGTHSILSTGNSPSGRRLLSVDPVVHSLSTGRRLLQLEANADIVTTEVAVYLFFQALKQVQEAQDQKRYQITSMAAGAGLVGTIVSYALMSKF